MNLPDLNRQNESFTRSLLQKAKVLQQKNDNEIDEVTTSTTDTNMSYDLGDIPSGKKMR